MPIWHKKLGYRRPGNAEEDGDRWKTSPAERAAQTEAKKEEEAKAVLAQRRRGRAQMITVVA